MSHPGGENLRQYRSTVSKQGLFDGGGIWSSRLEASVLRQAGQLRVYRVVSTSAPRALGEWRRGCEPFVEQIPCRLIGIRTAEVHPYLSTCLLDAGSQLEQS